MIPRLAAAIAVLALGTAVPGGGVLALGFLLLAEGRLAGGSDLGPALDWTGPIARLGWSAALALLFLAPALFLIRLAHDAQRIDPLGHAPLPLMIAAMIAGALGASLASRRWPAVRRAIEGSAWLDPLRLAATTLLGSAAWLLAPALLLIAARRFSPLFLIPGLPAMVLVLIHLPFLQARHAATGRLQAFLELSLVRASFARAPLAHLFALALIGASAVPAVLVQVFELPRDARALLELLVLPGVAVARLAVGLAVGRAEKRPAASSIWLARGASVAALGLGVVCALGLWLAPLIVAGGEAILLSAPPLLLP